MNEGRCLAQCSAVMVVDGGCRMVMAAVVEEAGPREMAMTCVLCAHMAGTPASAAKRSPGLETKAEVRALFGPFVNAAIWSVSLT